MVVHRDDSQESLHFRVIRLIPMTVLLAGVLSGFAAAEPPAAGDARLETLVAQLDDDDAETREAATRALIDASENVEELLEAAGRDGSPEVQVRAGRILRERRVRAVLRRPENTRLLEKLDDVTGGDVVLRRKALKGWVDGLARTAATVDVLLEMNAIDPNAAGGAANEALAWVCAPRLTARLAQNSSAVAGPPCSVMEMIESLVGSAAALRTTEAARALLEQAMSNGTGGGELLDALRDLCAQAQVSYRFDERAGAVILETAEESAAFWAAWWKERREDPIALMDLGLAKTPDGALLKKEDVGIWLDALDSPDPGRSRVARSVLKDIPEALFPEIDARTGSPAVTDLRDRLALRKLGRIAFVRYHERHGQLLTAHLDGSAERLLTDDTGYVSQLFASADGSAVFAVRVDAERRSSAWVVDLEGRKAPEKLADGGTGAMVVSGNGRWAASWEDGKPLRVIEFGKAEPLEFGGPADWPSVWSADGRRVAWICRGSGSFWIFDTETRKTLEVPDCLPLSLASCAFRWSPDGASIAVARQGHADGVAGEGPDITVEVVDARTGKRRRLSGPHVTVQALCWSPDGKKVAFAAPGPRSEARTLEVVDVEAGTVVGIEDPAPRRHIQSWISFAPDGRSFLYWTNAGTWKIDTAGGEPEPFPRPPANSAPLPGQDWMLAADGDIRLYHGDGVRILTVVESPEQEASPVFIGSGKR